MGKISDASAIYLGTQAVAAIYKGSSLVWQPSSGGDPAYGTGVYGDPLPLTTAGAPGPYTVVNTRRRVAAVLTSLESDEFGNGRPYRIDYDVDSASPGAIIKIDWCDLFVVDHNVVTGGHYGLESTGRPGGYNSTYRFVDFDVIGTVTINNITIRRIYEFSS